MTHKYIKISTVQWSVAVGMALLALVPSLVAAETVVRTGGTVTVASNQTVENDFYAAGSNVTVTGEVKEDVFAVAGTVTVNGKIGADLFALAGTVQVHAPVGDDIRVVGGDVVIADTVGGDVVVIAGRLQVLSSATIKGNVYFYGGEADIDGTVTGAVMGRAEAFILNGAVAGIDVSALRVELGDKAVVKGDVRYTSVGELGRAPGASVGGEVVQGTVIEQPEDGSSVSLLVVLTWVFTVLCFFLLFRNRFERLLQEVFHHEGRNGLIGAATFVGAPLLSLVLLVTVLGSLLGVIALLLTFLLFVATWIVVPILLGGYLYRFVRKGERLDFWAVGLGLLVIIILSFIPFIGGILILGCFLVTLGTIAHRLYHIARRII